MDKTEHMKVTTVKSDGKREAPCPPGKFRTDSHSNKHGSSHFRDMATRKRRRDDDDDESKSDSDSAGYDLLEEESSESGAEVHLGVDSYDDEDEDDVGSPLEGDPRLTMRETVLLPLHWGQAKQMNGEPLFPLDKVKVIKDINSDSRDASVAASASAAAGSTAAAAAPPKIGTILSSFRARERRWRPSSSAYLELDLRGIPDASSDATDVIRERLAAVPGRPDAAISSYLALSDHRFALARTLGMTWAEELFHEHSRFATDECRGAVDVDGDHDAGDDTAPAAASASGQPQEGEESSSSDADAAEPPLAKRARLDASSTS